MLGRLTVEENPVGINVSITVLIQKNTTAVNTHLLSSSISAAVVRDAVRRSVCSSQSLFQQAVCLKMAF